MKLGLGDSYDKVFINKKLRAYADCTKPASTLGVMGAYALASIFFFYYTGETANYADIVFVVVTIGLSHGASQALNMAEDAHIDEQTPHKQNRPIPSGVITTEEARTIAWVMILAAIGRAYLVSPQFGVMVSILIFFGVFYNLSPIRAKERVISIPWQAVSRGLFLYPTVWAAYGKSPLEPTALVLGVFMFWYVFGFQNSADIIDRKVDEAFGIQTFAVMFDVKGVGAIATGSTLLMVATVILGILSGILPSELIWLLTIIPFCMMMIYHMVWNQERVSDVTGNHPSWLHFYIGMVLSVLVPALVVYLGQ